MTRTVSLNPEILQSIKLDMKEKDVSKFSHYMLNNHYVMKHIDKQAIGLLNKLALETGLSVGFIINCMILCHFAERFAECKVSGQLTENLFVIGKDGKILKNEDLFNYYFNRSLKAYEAAMAEKKRLEKSMVPPMNKKPEIDMVAETKLKKVHA